MTDTNTTRRFRCDPHPRRLVRRAGTVALGALVGGAFGLLAAPGAVFATPSPQTHAQLKAPTSLRASLPGPPAVPFNSLWKSCPSPVSNASGLPGGDYITFVASWPPIVVSDKATGSAGYLFDNLVPGADYNVTVTYAPQAQYDNGPESTCMENDAPSARHTEVRAYMTGSVDTLPTTYDQRTAYGRTFAIGQIHAGTGTHGHGFIDSSSAPPSAARATRSSPRPPSPSTRSAP